MGRGEPLFRQWELLKTLQANRFGLCTDELARRLGCSRRTVQRDLRVLAAAFPLRAEDREAGRKYWTLAPHVLESEQLQLTVTEMLSLFLSQQLLLPLAGTQFGDGLQTALQKIRALLPQRALSYFEDLDESFLVKSLGWHDYSGQAGMIRALNQATLDQQAVRLTYHSASKGRDVVSEFHPYGMVLLQASLYCVGHLACYGEIRTLKVARIRSLTPLDKDFEKPEGFSLAGHLQGAFGVFQTDRPRTIRAEFTGWAATNVRELQWHPSQRIVEDDSRRVVATFELGNTVEFKRWVLGFGRYAKVIAPPTLAEEIHQEHLAAIAPG